MFDRLARLTFHHPKAVLAAVALFVVASGVLGAGVADRLLPAGFTEKSSDSGRAAAQAAKALGHDADPGVVVLARSRGRIDTPAARVEIARVARQLETDPEVAHVTTPWSRDGGRGLIARDGRSAIVMAYLHETDEGHLEDEAPRIARRVHSKELDLSVGGYAVGFTEVNQTLEDDLQRAELIAFPIVAVLLMIVFRGLVAALLPLVIGGIAVVGTFLILRVLSEITEVSIFALNITTAIGLGLAVDYGLLLTSRYREELARDGPTYEALRRTVGTAGRAVFFSGLTVAAALAALTILPQRFLYSMGAGGAAVSLLAAFAALLATPAMLALLGERVNALPLRGGGVTSEGTGRWFALANAVMRRPALVAIAAGGVLIAASVPFANVVLVQPGVDAVPRGQDSREVIEHLRSDFPADLSSPITVVVRRDADRTRAQLARLDGVREVAPARELRDGATLIQAFPKAQPLSEEAQDTVAEVRRIAGSAGGLVGGQTAEFIDYKDSLIDDAPMVIALVVATTMLILFLMTGSLILPLKTLVMNLLSIAATFGLLVLAFQHGLLHWAFAYDGPDAIETSLLVIIGATTFGLATDYAVLVLARIKEYSDRGHTDQEAVALGIERTGRVITAAAGLLAVVFLAFGTSSVYFMKEVAFGQAVAVIIDATIVRALLVPALMRLLGRWNWWAPGTAAPVAPAAGVVGVVRGVGVLPLALALRRTAHRGEADVPRRPFAVPWRPDCPGGVRGNGCWWPESPQTPARRPRRRPYCSDCGAAAWRGHARAVGRRRSRRGGDQVPRPRRPAAPHPPRGLRRWPSPSLAAGQGDGCGACVRTRRGLVPPQRGGPLRDAQAVARTDRGHGAEGTPASGDQVLPLQPPAGRPRRALRHPGHHAGPHARRPRRRRAQRQSPRARRQRGTAAQAADPPRPYCAVGSFSNGRRGAQRLRRHTDEAGAPTRSEFEDAAAAFVEHHDLGNPETNATVAGYEVDLVWRDAKLIVELDSRSYHDTPQAFEEDRERDAAVLAAGYVTVRITWERLTKTPRREAERLRQILAARLADVA